MPGHSISRKESEQDCVGIAGFQKETLRGIILGSAASLHPKPGKGPRADLIYTRESRSLDPIKGGGGHTGAGRIHGSIQPQEKID